MPSENIIIVNDKAQAALSLQYPEEKLRTIIASFSDYTIQLDDKLKILTINKPLSGLTPDEMVGTGMLDHVYPEEQRQWVKTILTEALESGNPMFFENDYLTSEGESLSFETRVVALENSMSGQNKTLLLSCRNITDYKRSERENRKLEQQCLQKKKLETIGSMASGIVHDFNNLLHPILAFSTMGLRKTEEMENLQSYFSSISIAANRARDLAQQLLTFSRNDEPDRVLFRLQTVIAEVLEIQRASMPATIEIKRDIDENCGMILADVTGIHQVMMNLTTNAHHAMLETGGELKVSLKTAVLKLKEQGGSGPQSGEYACITVSDTGTGMSSEVLKKIFDPFFSTKSKSKGTGLGLSMVSNIVNRHQGKIEVSSTQGKGSEFFVFLPLTTATVGKSCKKNKKEKLEGNEKILLVDDDDAIVALFNDALQERGYSLICKTDSLKAWEAVKSYPGRFNMVIADMNMSGMDGFQLALKILDIRPDMPIILLFSENETTNRKKARAIGIKKTMIKPVDPHKLSAIIQNIFDEK